MFSSAMRLRLATKVVLVFSALSSMAWGADGGAEVSSGSLSLVE